MIEMSGNAFTSVLLITILNYIDLPSPINDKVLHTVQRTLRVLRSIIPKARFPGMPNSVPAI